MLYNASAEQIERKFDALPEEERNAISPRYLERCRQEHHGVLAVSTTELLCGSRRSSQIVA